MDLDYLFSFKHYNYMEKKNYINRYKDVKTNLIYGKHFSIPPFVTVVIPTYKRPDMLKSAIESVLDQQDFDDYQILIVDNDSEPKNETEIMIKDLNSEKILYYRHDKNILVASWNRGISLARSEWVCFMHDDDTLMVNHLKTMSDIVKKHFKIDYLGCGSCAQIDDGNLEVKHIAKSQNLQKVILSKFDVLEYTTGATIPILGSFIKRESFVRVGGFYVGKHMLLTEDNVLSTKLSFHYNTYFIDAPLYVYRLHPGGSGGNWSKENTIITSVHSYNCAMSLLDEHSWMLKKIMKYVAIDTSFGSLKHDYVVKTGTSIDDISKYCKINISSKIILKYYKGMNYIGRLILKIRRKKKDKFKYFSKK